MPLKPLKYYIMKTKLTLLLLSFPIFLISKTNSDYFNSKTIEFCSEISKLDSLIEENHQSIILKIELDKKTDGLIKHKLINSNENLVYDNLTPNQKSKELIELLIEELKLNDNLKTIVEKERRMSCVKQFYTLYLLEFYYSYNNNESVVPFDFNKNIKIIKSRLQEIESEEYVFYSSNEAKPIKFKSISLQHANDFLMIGDLNQDRDMTGAFNLSIATDFFKARWFNIGWLHYLFTKTYPIEIARTPIVTYQTIDVGGVGFTPYIRYKDRTKIADLVYKMDRPFAFYTYLGRSKYRLWPRNRIRQRGQFQIGFLGLDAGRAVQASLHKDAIVSSQKVYGWENQIGSGGRLLFQLNHRWDFTIHNKDIKPYFGSNLFVRTEGFLGGYLTALDVGLYWTSLNFKQTSGQNELNFNRRKGSSKIFKSNFLLEGGIRYRRVIHNSTLEGFGYFNTFINDKYDDEAESVYVLNQDYYQKFDNNFNTKWSYPKPPKSQDDVIRNIVLIDFKVSVRFRKMMVYYCASFHTKEFEFDYLGDIDIENTILTNDNLNAENQNPNYNTILTNEEYKTYFNSKVFDEIVKYQERKFYGFGTIGVTWLIN